jgi:hypothetical protein
MHVHQSPHARSLEAKARFLGLTAIGDTAALHQVIDTGAFDSAQVVYNMLNPSAAVELPANYPAQDYGRLFDHTHGGRRRRRRHPRARRRRAVRIGRAPSDCECVEDDPAQLRNAVYELASIKLRREAWQRDSPLNLWEARHLTLALGSAIERVETTYSKHDELKALRSTAPSKPRKSRRAM